MWRGGGRVRGVISRQVIYRQVWKLKRKEVFCIGWKGDKSHYIGSSPGPVAEYRLLLKALKMHL